MMTWIRMASPIADDCDDQNPDINPNSIEIPGNWIDENCDSLDYIVATNNIPTILPHIFPNPTSGLLQIVFPNKIEGSYQLLDIRGRLIIENTLHKETTIDLRNQAQGVYLLLLKTPEGLWVETVVKI